MVNLMGYSVLVDNEEQAKKLQEIAFEQGFAWGNRSKVIRYLDKRSFQFGCSGKKVITFNPSGDHYQDEHITKKAHFNDLFETKFTPIAMKCTKEQFESIKPKLRECIIRFISDFNSHKYLVNNVNGYSKSIGNTDGYKKDNYGRTVYEEWNEELFLKFCDIEVESLEQQLEKAKAEVARLEKEIENNKIKVGDLCKFFNDNENDFVIGFVKQVNEYSNFKYETTFDCEFPNAIKITNPQLIQLLENERNSKSN